VVFLSNDYIAKAWTNSEFRGLWAKQIENRAKVILPIWYDVTFKEVYEFSPMVADLTAFASQIPADIAKWIRSAVGVAEQSRTVNDPLKNAVSQLQSDIKAKRLWETWAHQDGVKAIRDEWEKIVTVAQTLLNEMDNSTFSIDRGQGYAPQPITIEGPPVDVDGKETVDEKRIIYLLFTIRTASNTVYNAHCSYPS
jgi:hypothetical protein